MKGSRGRRIWSFRCRSARLLDLAARTEKVLDQRGALGSENAFDDLDAVVQDVGIGEAELTADSAEAEIAGAEDQAGNSGGDQSAGAHDARFHGCIEGRLWKAIVGDGGGGFTQGQDFGVGGGIVRRNGRVAAAAGDLCTDDDYGAHGDLA